MRLQHERHVKEKEYEVKLECLEDSHRHSTQELRDLLADQQRMSAKLVIHLTFCKIYRQIFA